MADRQARLSVDDQALKRETREAVAAAGGQDRAARNCRIGQQMLSECGSPNMPRFLPIDAARDLDAVTRGAAGWPIMLRGLARQIGCEVVELPEALPCTGDWHMRLAVVAKEHGDAIGPLMEALADGKICARDVRDKDLLREADQAIAAWVTIRAMLAQAAEG